MIDLSAVPLTDPLRVAIGAGDQRWDGWNVLASILGGINPSGFRAEFLQQTRPQP
jgi:hypothetical protein